MKQIKIHRIYYLFGLIGQAVLLYLSYLAVEIIVTGKNPHGLNTYYLFSCLSMCVIFLREFLIAPLSRLFFGKCMWVSNGALNIFHVSGYKRINFTDLIDAKYIDEETYFGTGTRVGLFVKNKKNPYLVNVEAVSLPHSEVLEWLENIIKLNTDCDSNEKGAIPLE